MQTHKQLGNSRAVSHKQCFIQRVSVDACLFLKLTEEITEMVCYNV